MKKYVDNEKIAEKIYASQMLKLHGRVIDKRITGSKHQIESPSQINNSPVILRPQQSFTHHPSSQKLSNILNVMLQPKTKHSIELFDQVRCLHKKNQSMVQFEQVSPHLTKNTSFHRPNSSVRLKQNNSELAQIQKIKEKIRYLFSQKDNNQDQKELNFMIKMNQVLNQLLNVIFAEQQQSSSHSTQDTFHTVQIDYFFKRQIHLIQQIQEQQIELQKQQGIIQQTIIQKQQLTDELKKLNELYNNQELEVLQQRKQIEELQCGTNIDSQEMRQLMQGQFEAIQKLLQREQLTKIFLKRVGDTSIVEMFDSFIQRAEQQNQDDDDEGNLNVDIYPTNKLVIPKKKNGQKTDQFHLPLQLIEQYEENYKQQINLSESMLADDSRINDSDESSFGYFGKEQATEISCYLHKKQIIQNQIPKQKLQINIKVVQNKKEEDQKILPDNILDNDDSNQQQKFSDPFSI